MFEKAQNEKSKVTYDFTNLWSTHFSDFINLKIFWNLHRIRVYKSII